MSAQTELIAKLGEIFQTDRADLDFGIYKILNSRSAEISDYLNRTLPAQIKNAMQGNGEHENQVYNHLLTFFSRYYDAGDFISQRRYKGNTYAIPYGGEEVMLHWANKDQYYTKSGENFSNYRFTLSDGRQVFFKLVQADTAKDNQKDNEQNRLFVLAQAKEQETDEDGEIVREAVSPIIVSDGVLTVSFEYKAMPKGAKQKECSEEAVAAITAHPAVQADWTALFERAPTDKDPNRTVLAKHLADYTAKNSADYFIHKDLGGFLQRELDFYIKNEVMDLDNIHAAESFEQISGSLKMIQTLRAIARDIIAFLAQLENFQKKLWLKKKFVVGSHWLITLDRVPSEFHEEVFANPAQQQAWKNLFAINELPPPRDLISLTESNPYLVVDTSLFDPEFGARLVSVLSNQSNLDEQTDGLLIHADNFQALNLLQTRYRSQVKCIYIDPPYNTGGDGFIYKDNYQHSSWATCIENRIKASYPFIKYDGVFSISADDNEQANLKQICNYLFGQENFIAQTIWERAYSPVNLKKHFSESHDYLLFFAKNISNLKCNGIPRSDDGSNRYSNPDNDPRGNWKSSDLSVGPAVQENIYPITTPSGRIVLPPNGYSWRLSKTRFDEYVQDNRIWFGKNGNNVPSIKRFLSEVKSTVTPMTIWKYQNVGHSQSASQDLKNMFGEARFTYPKSVPLIQQAIGLYSERNSLILDYFAGSGTTAHAVINLNREDGGKRKYILVEQGEYFNTVLKPRIQKAVYAAEWKDGKPVADGEGRLKGVSQAVKVLKLESYEDTLNNLQLARPADLADMGRQPENLKQEYLLHYMLNVESRGSLLSTDAFKKPFDYRMNIAADSAGATKETRVDLVETFNYLLGLTVDAVDDKRFSHGYVLIEGYLKNPSERVLIVWRDCEKWDYDTLPKLLDKKKILAEDSEFTEIYINGDHTLPTVFQDDDADGGAQRTLKIQSIDETFLRLMFEGA